MWQIYIIADMSQTRLDNNKAQLILLNQALAIMQEKKLDTTIVNQKIEDCERKIRSEQQHLDKLNAIAQNNVDAAAIKESLITALGVDYTWKIKNSECCPIPDSGCDCLGCLFTNYQNLGMTVDQIKTIL
jgi:hypothetical protein